jgi:uncharacterized membrane-anchored protein YjiN (DUF445 family)
MEPTAPVSNLEREPVELRVRRLAAARRRATALLAGVSALFIAVTAAGVHGTLLGYVQAGAEAAMVGGVADWFAVTALFRHPLGLPIPHTALIVERKDQFAGTLGQFVQENFLNADVLVERIRLARLVPRLAGWLADEANTARFAGRAADLAVSVAEALRDEDVQRVLTAELTRAIDAVEVAPLAGRVLRVIIAGEHHAELFNAAVSAADRYLGDHQAELRELFEGEAPRWVPDAVYRRIFDRLYSRLRQRLVAMAADPGDETRQQFEEWLARLPGRLETSPELRERGERLKRDVLGSAVLRDWSSSLWQKAKETLRTQAADPESELRRRLAGALAAAGRRLGSDRRLQESLERVVESGTRALADQFHDELAGLVTGTIERWDAAQTSSQLELLLGRDLQFIRINGTVVGASVGLILHAIVLALSLSDAAATIRSRRVSPAPQAPSAAHSPIRSIHSKSNAEHSASTEKKVPYQVSDLPYKPDVPRYPAGPAHQDPPAYHQTPAPRRPVPQAGMKRRHPALSDDGRYVNATRPQTWTISARLQGYVVAALTSCAGSDLAGQASAALASSAIVFKTADPKYSARLLSAAQSLFTFADTNLGNYSDCITTAQGFYNSFSGYWSQLVAAEIWLYRATGSSSWLTKAQTDYANPRATASTSSRRRPAWPPRPRRPRTRRPG